MRTLTDHVVNGCNDKLAITVEDEPGHGGANHCYLIEGFTTYGNPAGPHHATATSVPIIFQNGPIKEFGVNGVTHEALMAIVMDRLRSFQAGPFACRENALALTKIEEAMHWLQHRTRVRVARGVEGTNEK